MYEDRIRELLESVSRGRTSVESALESLRDLPCEEMEWACLDHHRALRQSLPEVVYGPGKTTAQLVKIVESLISRGGPVLVTRVSADQARAVTDSVPGMLYNEVAGTLSSAPFRGRVCDTVVYVVTGGTSDIPVAEEACVTLKMTGQAFERLYDVGVAGVHRLISRVDELRRASAIVAVAGMDGVLPSLIGGLVRVPVIAVPVDTGYGANFGGLAPLLAMLNSCAPGVAVVNINNGFGAAVMASMISRTGE